MEQIITSLLDNDLYKVNMGQVLLNQFADADVVWEYKNRDAATRKFTQEMVDEIKAQVKKFCELKFLKEEIEWLGKACPWLSKAYLSFLQIYQPQFDWYDIRFGEDGQIKVTITGPQYLTTFCETPTMSIISEVWFRLALTEEEYKDAEKVLYERTEAKIEKLVNAEWTLGAFSDFGTRRRFSKNSMEKVLKMYIDARTAFTGGTVFVGTSNMYFAKKFNVKPVGTMAHELIQVIGQGYPERNPAYSNKFVMDAWHKEFGTENGVYLTDCIGTDVFLRDFDKVNAKLFDGVRHDSGDPMKWAEKMIAHYEKLGINPKTKTLLFSDGLDFDKAASLYGALSDRVKIAFGIGTYVVADTNVKHMNQVLKVVEVRTGNETTYKPVAKLSDVDGKNMCRDPEYIEYLKRTIAWRMNH